MIPSRVDWKMKSVQDENSEKKGSEQISTKSIEDSEGGLEETSNSDNRAIALNSKKRIGVKKTSEADFKRTMYVETTSDSGESDCIDSTQNRKSRLSLRNGKKVRRYNLTTNHQGKRKNFGKMTARNQFEGHFMFPIRRGHKYDEETIQEICKRMKRGESSKSLASEIGADVQTVKAWRKKYAPELDSEILKERKMPVYDNNIVREACNRLILGDSPKEVSAKFGASTSSVNYWHKKYIKNGKVKLTERKINFGMKRILELCERMKRGESTKSIASEIGACVETVRHWRKTYAPELAPEAKTICVYDNNKVREACNRLILGDSLKEVAEKFGTVVNTVKEWQAKYIKNGKVTIPLSSRRLDKETIMELCGRMKQGETSKSVASETGLNIDSIRRWRKTYAPELAPEAKTICIYDNDTVNEACNRLILGDSLKEVAEKFGTVINTVKEWQAKYIKDGKVTIPLDSRRLDQETIMELCERMRQGESSRSIACETGLNINALRKWRKKYVPELEPEERKICVYDNSILLEACNRLILGDSVKEVSDKFQTEINTVKKWQTKYIKDGKVTLPLESRRLDQETIMEICERMRQGESSRSIAWETGLNVNALRKWRKKYAPDIEPEERDVSAYDNSTVLEACNRLIGGDSIQLVSKSFGIDVKVVKSWQTKYIKGGRVELKLRPKKYDESTKREVCKRLKRGELAADLAMEFGVSSTSINNWKQQFIEEGLKVRGLKRRCSTSVIPQSCKKTRANDSVNAQSRGKVIQNINHGGLSTPKVKPKSDGSSMEEQRNRLSEKYNQVGASTWTGNNQKRKDFSERPSLFRKQNTKVTSIGSNKELTTEPVSTARANLNFSSTRKQQRAKSKTFFPLDKVCLPKGLKLEVVKLIDRGISIPQLSKQLDINGVTLKSWMLNRNLLMEHSL